MTQSPDDSSPRCIICGGITTKYSNYCKNVHCQQKYERKLAILHNSKEYRMYIKIYRYQMETFWMRGDVESID